MMTIESAATRYTTRYGVPATANSRDAFIRPTLPANGCSARKTMVRVIASSRSMATQMFRVSI